MRTDSLQWHPAFLSVLQLELESYISELQFEGEHPLTTKPLQIDVVVIKKESDTVIDNPIARIFRTVNVFEYKSPTISLSFGDFHRALAYIFLYSSTNKINLTDMSLSIVVTKKPEKMFKYIQNILKYEIKEREKGIYEVKGFPFSMQIIENKKLEKGYLPLLDNKLDREEVTFVLTEAQKPHGIDISAFIDIIIRANLERLEELSQMGNKTLEEVLEKVGLAARWEARGEARGKALGEAQGEARGKALGEAQGEARGKEIKAKEFAQKLIKKGWDSAEIAETTELDLATVESLMGASHA